MFVNTKKQGDWGLGQAIGHFTAIGWTVSIPLTDSQDYDMIVDNGVQLLRVQVKTTTFRAPSGNYMVSLTVKGGNRSYNTIKKFDRTKVDAIFIVTADNVKYLIPTENVGNTITLYAAYDQYKL